MQFNEQMLFFISVETTFKKCRSQMFFIMVLLKILQYYQENTCAGTTVLKRDFNSGFC